MYTKVIFLLFLACQFLIQECQVEAKRFFGVGQRIVGDQLLLKDLQHSRPAGLNEQPSVTFQYEIAEPITYIEIVSEENIFAEVKFSYINQLIVGIVTGHNSENMTEDQQGASFDVSIMIFGFNDTMLNVNPSLLINRDQHFEGELLRDTDDLSEDGFEEVDEMDYEDDYKKNSLSFLDEGQRTDAPIEAEEPDKIIEIGHRQEGDQLVYESYQTSPDVSKEQTNHSVTFYYIDSELITYVKFVILDHFSTQEATSADYVAPVAEYSHYSNSTLKAIITDYNTSSLFVQMFVYGYHAQEAPPSYEPFLPPPHWQRSKDPHQVAPVLTPMQRIQLAMLLNKVTTGSPDLAGEHDDDDDDDKPRTISPEDLEFTQLNNGNDIATDQRNAAFPQLDKGFGAVVGLFLLILYNMDN